MEPAPERSTRRSWATFLKAQWGAVAATDFFSVEVLTWTGIVRFHVFSKVRTKPVPSTDYLADRAAERAIDLLDALDRYRLRQYDLGHARRRPPDEHVF
jgi:hypothetical protein